MRELVLRGATGVVKSKPSAALEAFLDIRFLQSSMGVQTAQAHYWIKNEKGVKLVEGSGPRELTSRKPLDRNVWSLFLTNSIWLVFPVGRNKPRPVAQHWKHLVPRWIEERRASRGGVYNLRGGKGIIIPLGTFTTINQAEMTDILAATQYAVQEKSRRNVYICTASRPALTAVQSITAYSITIS